MPCWLVMPPLASREQSRCNGTRQRGPRRVRRCVIDMNGVLIPRRPCHGAVSRCCSGGDCDSGRNPGSRMRHLTSSRLTLQRYLAPQLLTMPGSTTQNAINPCRVSIRVTRLRRMCRYSPTCWAALAARGAPGLDASYGARRPDYWDLHRSRAERWVRIGAHC
jgi:hypothetical protein